jgi:nucleoside-diphosphate-sugar epimerase
MKALITGGTGFIGSRLALASLDRREAVTALGQENTPAEETNRRLIEERGAQVVLASVTDHDRLAAAMKGIDVVYHLAAAQHEMNVPDRKFWDVNVEGTRGVLDAALAAGVKRVVHGSTIGVYGVPAGVIDEETPCNPENIYGVTKLEGEKLALSFRHRLPVVAIRIPEVYGPGDRRLLKLFRAVRGGSFFVIGNGENLHHLIYVDDLIQGLFLAAEHPEAVGQIILLAGPSPISTKEMARTIAEDLGIQPRKMRLPLWPFLVAATVMEGTLRPVGIQPPLHRRRMDFFRKSFTLSTERAERLLGFRPTVSFREGVSRTARWYEQMGYL